MKRAIERLVGQHQTLTTSDFNMSLSEALRIQRNMPGALEEVVVRECAGMGAQAFEACQLEVQREAFDRANSGTNDGQQTLAVLRSLLNALKTIDGPKTMILVSEGFVTDEQRDSVVELGAIAAASRTSIYALKLDDQLFASAASEQRAPISTMDDRFMRAEGLELLTNASRGALFDVVGTGATLFDRIERELSGYYLLGVESSPADRDGRTHSVRVQVNRKGLTIRSRRALVTQPDDKPKSARDRVVAAIATPLPISALPLRIATFSLQGPEQDRVQVLIHADIGTDYASPRGATIGYSITDRDGRMVDSQVGEGRLPPIMNGVPSPLQFTAGASLPPGDYLLKLAVNEGDRLGTVEHEFTAAVVDAGAVKVSDLMAGGPLNGADDLLQPTISYTVMFGTVQGYVEAYGTDVAKTVKATFELAASETSAALVSQDVTPRAAGGGVRAIFSRTLPVRQLPPGKYVLRAVLSGAHGPLRTLTRAFEVAAPAVLMTSAESGATLSTSDVFLPVEESMLLRPFDKASASKAPTLQSFRQRVAVPAREAFDAGVSALSSGDYAKAEASLKSALATDADNAAVLAYLAAVFASSGHDDQATGAWQTSLVDGSDIPDIYEWLGDALIRTRRLAEARAVLEEAMTRWPGDLRFIKPMAIVDATFGQGPEAVRLLARYIEAHPDDVEALQLGVEWIYHLTLAHSAARTPAEDVRLAHRYADAYVTAKGPQQALVQQWIEYLDRSAAGR
jgi:tetratricopeptide (TPR) repeat protein